MKILRIVFNETFGIFVDDGSLAFALLAWISVAGFVLPKIIASSTLQMSIWFVGVLIILVENAVRSARKISK